MYLPEFVIVLIIACKYSTYFHAAFLLLELYFQLRDSDPVFPVYVLIANYFLQETNVIQTILVIIFVVCFEMCEWIVSKMVPIQFIAEFLHQFLEKVLEMA